jgi:signal transduction histidine kinase
MSTSIESPPRVRVEWLVAVARVVLAAGVWIAILFDPLEPGRGGIGAFLFACYLAFSVGILALVWSPTRFGRGWAVGLHLYDLAAFTVLMVAEHGAASPFFATLTFLLVCAAIRWSLRGVLWTAAAALVTYTIAILLSAATFEAPDFVLPEFLIRVVSLCVMTALLAYLATHERRFRREISRLAAWPRTVSRDPHTLVAEVLSRASELLDAPRLVLVWDDPDDARVNVAFFDRKEVLWTVETEGTFGSVVAREVHGRSFETNDAARERADVIVSTSRGFGRRRCHPIDERLRTRFDMRRVESWPLDGELVRGRVFCLDKSGMSLDDLVTGESVARLAASRLDSLYLLHRLRDATALEERVRVARDLHDSLLQSQAGAALQLLAARRQFERDPEMAKQRLDDVQRQLERGELEMRSFIKSLRPRPRAMTGDGVPSALSERLLELRERVERQWELKVLFHVDAEVARIPEPLADHVYRLLQEAVLNAARHADASVIRGEVIVNDGRIRLTIVDDGKGYPFTGSYDLASLGSMNQGPLTLRERVTELKGDLQLTTSFDTGTELLITVPLGSA